MKKMLQLIISGSLLLVFSCSGDGTGVTDTSSVLQETWALRSVAKYNSVDCSSDLENTVGEYEFNGESDGSLAISTDADCADIADFFVLTG